MATTEFTNNVTLTDADWFNDVDRVVYDILGDPATADAAVSSLGIAVVQRGYAEYTTNTDLSTSIPADDSIPQQSTEGTLIASVSITPKSASNRIRIRCQGFISGPNTAGGAFAVFQDSTEDAIAATIVTFSTAAPTVQICLEFEVSAASTSARTYKLHAGGTSTVRMNGSTSGRYFGGVAKTTMVVEEIKG